MRELQREIIGDRRVTLHECDDDQYTVTIEVRGPKGSWEDISLRADQALAYYAARRRYRQRVAEQQTRATINI